MQVFAQDVPENVGFEAVPDMLLGKQICKNPRMMLLRFTRAIFSDCDFLSYE